MLVTQCKSFFSTSVSHVDTICYAFLPTTQYKNCSSYNIYLFQAPPTLATSDHHFPFAPSCNSPSSLPLTSNGPHKGSNQNASPHSRHHTAESDASFVPPSAFPHPKQNPTPRQSPLRRSKPARCLLPQSHTIAPLHPLTKCHGIRLLRRGRLHRIHLSPLRISGLRFRSRKRYSCGGVRRVSCCG